MKFNRTNALSLSIALFILSCFLPAINHKIGLINLVFGFLFPFYPLAWPYFFFWCANIIYYIEVKQFRKGKNTNPIGLIAFMLAVFFYIFETVIGFKTFSSNQEMTIGIGYYIWAISFTILPIYQMNLKYKKAK